MLVESRGRHATQRSEPRVAPASGGRGGAGTTSVSRTARRYRLRMRQTCSEGKRLAQSAVTVPFEPVADSGALIST